MEILKPHMLKPAPGSKKKPTRKGQGIAAGKGKTAGRGTKGQKARYSVPPGFEGGNFPLYLRIPKKKGFKPPKQKEYVIVNVGRLEEAFEAGEEVTPEEMVRRGVVKKIKGDGVKVLGEGELTKPLVVKAHAFSRSALEKIQAAGGRAEVI